MFEPVKYIELTPANFDSEVIDSEIPVLVDFWAVWCGPCRVMNPIIEQVAANWAGKVKVGKADVEQNQAIATEYNIQAIPTILIFHQGKVIERIPSIISQANLEAKLEELTSDLLAA